MEASGEPGAGLWSFNAARKPRSRKGSRLTAIRRTGPPGFRSRFEGPNPGCFSCSTGGRLCFLFAGTKGGGTEHKKAVGVEHPPHSLNSFVFYVFVSLLVGFQIADTEKSGKTIATPPETGVPTGPV